VRFVYDSEEERYTKERIEGEIDAELMDRLEPDLDLLEFLPAGEVEAGATWELDPEALRHFFAAGGDLGFEVTEAVAEMEGVVPREILVAGALGSLHELFAPGSELSGKVEASYAGEHESGSELARLELEIHVEARIDLGARLQLLLGEDVLPGHREFTVEGELEGRLVVLWNQARKHLGSARFEGEASLSGHLVFPVEIAEGHPALEFVGDYELAGEAEVELVVE
jgi:hypothetical protein